VSVKQLVATNGFQFRYRYRSSRRLYRAGTAEALRYLSRKDEQLALMDAVEAMIGLAKDGSSPQSYHVRDLTREISDLEHRLRAIEAVISAVAKRSDIRPEELEPRPLPLVARFVRQLLRKTEYASGAS
jgi:hypothetical protein